MALTPTEIDALSTYTSAQHLKMWKRADIEVAGGGVSYAINGRSLTRANAKEIRDNITFWEDRVALDDAGENGGNVLVKFGERA
jgi:hypothetical protein